MKKIFFAFALITFISAGLAPSVLAHETHNYRIGGKAYQIVVGSMNEPIAVDDNTGVDMRIAIIQNTNANHDGGHGSMEGAVEGLDQTLRVELQAGNNKKILDLSPKHGEAGRYTAKFFPTIQTTYTYRFFGTINNTPVDLSFTCNPAGHPMAEEDKNEIQISEGVARTLKRGAFGCPISKTSLGFPEASASINELSRITEEASSSARTLGTLGIILGIAGIAIGVFAIKKSK